MFQKESCQPRKTATLLFNGNKIPLRLTNLKLLVAATFYLLVLGKKALAPCHPLQAAEYVSSVLAAGVGTQGCKVDLSKFLIIEGIFAVSTFYLL